MFAWSRSITGQQRRASSCQKRRHRSGRRIFGGVGLEIIRAARPTIPGFVGIVSAPDVRSSCRGSATRRPSSPRRSTLGPEVRRRRRAAVGNPARRRVRRRVASDRVQARGAGRRDRAARASPGTRASGASSRARVQHLDAAGAEVFAHNGVEISLEPSRSELYPSIVQLGGDVIVFYNKRNSGQSAWGIGGQRISSTGQLLWGNNGLEFVPYDATAEEAPRAVPAPNGAMCFVEQGNFGTTLIGLRASTANGVASWAPSPHPACTLASGKDKLRVIAASDGTAHRRLERLARGPNNVYAQNVELDGSLGVPPALVTPYGCGWNPAGHARRRLGLAVDRHDLHGRRRPTRALDAARLDVAARDLAPPRPGVSLRASRREHRHGDAPDAVASCWSTSDALVPILTGTAVDRARIAGAVPVHDSVLPAGRRRHRRTSRARSRPGVRAGRPDERRSPCGSGRDRQRRARTSGTSSSARTSGRPGTRAAAAPRRDRAAIRERLKALVKERGLAGRVRVNAAGCLDFCETGVSIVVYPENVWYGHVTLADVEEIVDPHLARRRAGRAPPASGRRRSGRRRNERQRGDARADARSRVTTDRARIGDRAPSASRARSAGRASATSVHDVIRPASPASVARGAGTVALSGRRPTSILRGLPRYFCFATTSWPAVAALRVRDGALALSRLLREDVLVEVDAEPRTACFDAQHLERGRAPIGAVASRRATQGRGGPRPGGPEIPKPSADVRTTRPGRRR